LTESFLFLPDSSSSGLGSRLSRPARLELESSSIPLVAAGAGSSGERTGSRSSPGKGSPALSAPKVPSGSAGAVFAGITGTVLVSSGKGLVLEVVPGWAAPASGFWPSPAGLLCPVAAASPPSLRLRQQQRNHRQTARQQQHKINHPSHLHPPDP